jgi:hypothetical protein
MVRNGRRKDVKEKHFNIKAPANAQDRLGSLALDMDNPIP